jgi:hypothetical protein
MNVSLILRCLPPLVAIDNIFIDDANLLIDPEHWGALLVLHFIQDGFCLLVELVNLLQLDQKKLVPDDRFYQADKLFSRQNVQGDQIDVKLLIWEDSIVFKVYELVLHWDRIWNGLTLVFVHVLLNHLEDFLMIQRADSTHTV